MTQFCTVGYINECIKSCPDIYIGADVADDEQWLSKYLNHFRFQVTPLF